MIFFVFQPEIFSTINIIMGLRIGGFAATVIFSTIFVVLLIIGYFFLRKKYSLSTIMVSAALIVWLPLFSHFFYNSLKEFDDTWFVLFRPEAEQIIWRYCRIDKHQNLNGSLCGLYPFIEQVKKYVPKGAKVSYAYSSSAPFLSYYLYRDYEMVNNDKAEYIILYRPYKPHFYEKGILYEGLENKKEIASGQIVISFGPGQLIFKTQTK